MDDRVWLHGGDELIDALAVADVHLVDIRADGGVPPRD